MEDVVVVEWLGLVPFRFVARMYMLKQALYTKDILPKIGVRKCYGRKNNQSQIE
jgi:hypothetical protein